MARRGSTRRGLAGRGEAGVVGRGRAGQGLAWLGRAGEDLISFQERKTNVEFTLPTPQSKLVYKWSFGHNADPNQVGKELEEISRQTEGKITQRDVVARARSEDSVMHNLFEWNDDLAAEKYREAQAGTILRHLRIEIDSSLVTNDEPGIITIRPYINVEVSRERFYSPISVVIRDDAQREYALKDLRDSLLAWRRKSATFNEFASVNREIDRIFSDGVVELEDISTL